MSKMTWCSVAELLLASALTSCAGNTPTSCQIGDTLYQGGSVNPASPCQSCQPAVNPLGWSPIVGVSCDAGTSADAGSGPWVTDAGPTDAGPTDAGPTDAGPEDAGPPSCSIAGVPYADSQLNPANDCQSCQPGVNKSAWSNLVDATPCSDGGICSEGSCIQGCFIDGGVVLSGTADPGGCLVCSPGDNLTFWSDLPAGTVCADDGGVGVCYAGECRAGCVIAGSLYAPNDFNGQNTCQSCQPSASTSSWTNQPSGIPCGNGDLCDYQGGCRPPCAIGSLQVAQGASNPADPSQCCNATLDPSEWSPRLVWSVSFPISQANDMVAADFNNDGWLDLAVVNVNVTPSFVAVFMNQQGVLMPAGTYSVTGGQDPWAVAAADLNGDGFDDLITGNEGNGANIGLSVSVLIGKGDGTFYPQVDYPAGGISHQGVKAGKLWSDPTSSVVATNYNAGLVYYPGIGDGGLLAPIVVDSQQSDGELELADLNSDGLLDIVDANWGSGSVAIYLGTRDGGFTARSSHALPTTPPLQSLLWDVKAGDLNGDGILDLAGAFENSQYGSYVPGGTVGVLLGQGNGVFGQWNAIAAPGDGAYGIAIADLDGDGTSEVLFSSFNSPSSLYQLAPGDAGTVQPMLSADGGMGSILVGDFNNDGAQDLATIGSGDVSIYINGCP